LEGEKPVTTSKEIIRRVVDFSGPERIEMSFTHFKVSRA